MTALAMDSASDWTTTSPVRTRVVVPADAYGACATFGSFVAVNDDAFALIASFFFVSQPVTVASLRKAFPVTRPEKVIRFDPYSTLPDSPPEPTALNASFPSVTRTWKLRFAA